MIPFLHPTSDLFQDNFSLSVASCVRFSSTAANLLDRGANLNTLETQKNRRNPVRSNANKNSSLADREKNLLVHQPTFKVRSPRVKASYWKYSSYFYVRTSLCYIQVAKFSSMQSKFLPQVLREWKAEPRLLLLLSRNSQLLRLDGKKISFLKRGLPRRGAKISAIFATRVGKKVSKSSQKNDSLKEDGHVLSGCWPFGI